MAAPNSPQPSLPPSTPTKNTPDEFSVPSRSNGTAHVDIDGSTNPSTSQQVATGSANENTENGQAPLSSPQPPLDSDTKNTSSLLSQPRVVHTEPHTLGTGDKPEETSTLTTITPKGTTQSRKKEENSASHQPPANGHGKPNPSRAKPVKKSSFLSRMLHKLVPCISTSKTHVIELETSPPPATTPKESQASVTEKADAPVVEPTTPSKPDSPALRDAQEAVLDETGLTPLPAPVPQEGSDIIIPPTPTKTLPVEETEGVTSGAVVPPGSTGGVPDKHSRASTVPSTTSTDGDESDSFTEEDIDDISDDDPDELILLNGGAGIPIGPDGVPKPLLPPIAPQHAGRKCLILDLDETLVHSSFKSIQQADYVVPVEIEYHWHNVYVIKRPGVDNFLKKMGEIYEVVVFTASLSKYADPVLDKLDIHKVVAHRLFRESCYNHRGNYVKDLSQLGRPVADTIILDNSPASYIFHPNNAVPVSSWFNDPHDTELTDLVPFLADLSTADDVRGVLDGAR